MPLRRPSSVIAIAPIALLVALGSSGYAAVTLNDQNKNPSTAGTKLNRNTIPATEVNESRRGKSRAHTAQVGTTVRSFSFVEGSNASREILNFAGVVIRASCQNNDLHVTVAASGSGQLQSASTHTTDKDETAFNETLRELAAGPVNILPARDNSQLGHTEITRRSGQQVSIHWAADNPGIIDDCVFSGNAVTGG
jgi:hypothetical protein